MIADSRQASAAARVRPPADLLLPARGRARGRARAEPTATRTARRRATRRTTRSAPAARWSRPAPGTTRSCSRRAEPSGPDRVLLAAGWTAGYEEDEEIVVHPRDPYHRVDVLAHRPPHPGLARRRAAGRDRPGDGAVRDQPAGPLVHAARGRRGRRWSRPTRSRAARTRARRATTRSSCNGEDGKDLIWYYDEPLAKVGRIAGPAVLLQREGRHRARRRG